MRIAKVLLRLGRIVAYGTLIITALTLLFWPYVNAFFPPLSTSQVAGLLLGIITIIVIDFYHLVAGNRPGSVVYLDHTTIADGIRVAVVANTQPRHVRVLASTSEVILPLIRDSGVHIQTCDLMIQQFDPKGSEKDKTLSAKCDGIISTWKDLKTQGIIEHLVVKRFSFVPLHYFIAFDDERLVVGLFQPVELPAHAVDYYKPVIITDATVPGKMLIQKYTQQFDDLFRSLPEHTRA